ncbi:MAG: putative glycosyltransferase, partial [Bryobacterales bacterium]|nr:putative glycosyltransferase [Bryobacterales bacterium]
MIRKSVTAPERPSVLFVGNFLDPVFGSRAISEDLALELNARGWRVTTVSNRRRKLARLLHMVGVVWSRRKQFDVAVLDVYSGPAFIFTEVVGWVLRRIRKPYVLVLHGGNLPAFSQKWPARVGRQLRAAAAITTPSRYLQEQMGCYGKDLGLIPNPLTLRNYRFALRERARPALVWLRAFHRLYNPALAVAAVGLLVRDFPKISLTMIGPDKGGGSLQEAKQLAEELGVSDRVHFAGPIPKAKVASFLEQADVFLNTTSVDNTPVSVLEAMA